MTSEAPALTQKCRCCHEELPLSKFEQRQKDPDTGERKRSTICVYCCHPEDEKLHAQLTAPYFERSIALQAEVSELTAKADQLHEMVAAGRIAADVAEPVIKAAQDRAQALGQQAGELVTLGEQYLAARLAPGRARRLSMSVVTGFDPTHPSRQVPASDVTLKRCCTCHKPKPLSDFSWTKRKRLGFDERGNPITCRHDPWESPRYLHEASARCKECIREDMRARRAEVKRRRLIDPTHKRPTRFCLSCLRDLNVVPHFTHTKDDGSYIITRATKCNECRQTAAAQSAQLQAERQAARAYKERKAIEKQAQRALRPVKPKRATALPRPPLTTAGGLVMHPHNAAVYVSQPKALRGIPDDRRWPVMVDGVRHLVFAQRVKAGKPQETNLVSLSFNTPEELGEWIQQHTCL